MQKSFVLSFGAALALICVIFSAAKAPQNGKHKAEEREQPPSDWFIAQRMFPYDKVDYDAYGEVVQQAQTLRASARQMGAMPVWQLEGPTNLEGRVSDIEMNPLNQQEIYVGAASGGVWKSTDGGNSWNPIFDQNPSLSIGDIALAPSKPSLIYVGTGEANGGSGSITYDGQGIFKSSDGGASWTSVGLQITRNTGRIVIDPKDTNRVFAATMGDLYGKTPDRGVYRTTNGGASWQKVLYVNDSTGVIDLVINPKCPDTLFAAAYQRVRRPNERDYGGVGCNIYRTVDGGNTWTLLSIGLPASDPNTGRIGLTISTSTPNVLFAVYSDIYGNCIGVYKTVNNGNSWYQVDGGNASGVLGTQGWWYGRIAVDPYDTSVVYIPGFDLYKSLDGGMTWNNISSGYTHVDHHTIYIHPQNTSLVVNGNDGGVYFSNDAGATFYGNAKLPIMQFYTAEIDYQSPTQLCGGAQDNGTNASNGSISNWGSVYGGDGFYCLVDPTNSSNQIYEYQYGNLSTSIVGLDFYPNERHNWNTPLVLNPQNPASIYYGSNYLYKSVDYWQTWNPISGDLTDGASNGNLVFNSITTIAVSNADTNVIYVGTDDGNVQVSQNNGGSWTNISSGLPKRWVTRVTADPQNAGTAYVTLSGYRYHDNTSHIYKTTNYGNTWADIGYNLPTAPVNDVVVDVVAGLLYCATDVGVYYKGISATSWAVLGTGLPLVPVSDLTFHEPTGKLVAATYGRSMYSIDLSQFSAIHAVQSPRVQVRVFPNPATANFVVSLDKEPQLPCSFVLCDEKGAVVQTSPLKQKETSISRGLLPAGVYFYRISISQRAVQHGTLIFQ